MKHGHDDASMTDGRLFQISDRRSGGLFGMFDAAPPRSDTVSEARRSRRKRWPLHQMGTQIAWDAHGKIQILRLVDGSEIAVWWEETCVYPEK